MCRHVKPFLFYYKPVHERRDHRAGQYSVKERQFFLKIYGKVPLIYRKPVNFQIELIKTFLKYLNSANDIDTF